MKIGIPRETREGETRVALIPPHLKGLINKNHAVYVEAGAGTAASFPDEEYKKEGAVVVGTAKELFAHAEVVLKVQSPQTAAGGEMRLLKDGGVYIGFLSILQDETLLSALKKKNITSFAMEFVPRITRAQSMDVLSSMATIAGYKAVLLGANRLPKMFPLLMTAAGTIPPGIVLVLGAGVAGLQAIATARRLGAKVEAFDPRPVVKEQVQSLGAQFIEMELDEEVETAGGYAKMQSDEFLRKEQEAIAARLPKIDVVVTTAQIFGKKSPVLITKEMVARMRPGSVIVDIAAEQGGNCELTQAGKEIEFQGVTIIGAVNLPAAVPVHASQMYSKNITNLFNHLFPGDDSPLNLEDEIAAGACVTHKGELVNEFIKKRIQGGGA